MEKRIEIEPVSGAEVLRLQSELGCSFVLAQVLARRGLGDPTAAREFMSAAERHLPAQFEGIDTAVGAIRAAIESRDPIVVHGDYDVDGVSATAILIGALRELGAEADWFIPSRVEDGYGLSAATVEKLAARGTRLLITADCGITAVEEVALARELGIDVIVTDHHSPRADGALPDAPIVHPVVSGYPCRDLCGAGVAHKLVAALAGEQRADADLDLVALATVADCVPLLGENRRLVRDGLRAIATTRRPGLRALMAVSETDPSRLDTTALAFRLAPRINAAGRVARADAAVDLLLTGDPEHARAIADRLDARNAERRHEEQRMRFEAEAQVAELDPDGSKRALVIAGEGWHPGVIGIVASRIVERHNRPVVVVAFDGDHGTASGRSIAGFDLLAALTACGEHLERFGGHRAAAGATLRRSQLDAFRAAFEAHAAATLTPADLIPRQRADAVVSGDELGTDLAEELAQLAPFGIGNPQVALLVPAAEITDRATMGDGKHLRFSVRSGGVRARGVAFGTTTLPDAERHDAVFALELNEFRGAIEPRLLLRAVSATAPDAIELVGEPQPGTPQWLEIATAPAPPTGSAAFVGPQANEVQRILGGEGVADRRGRGLAGTIMALVATGEPVLVVAADARARARHLEGLLGGFSLTSWGALTADLAAGFAHVVALDPPTRSDRLAAISGPSVHLAWGSDELHFAHGLLAGRDAPRAALTALYRSLRDSGIDRLEMPAWQVRELLAVLVELGLAEPDGRIRRPAGRAELEASARFRALEALNQEALRWLSSAMPRAA